jgi:hypothetical protein
MSEIKKEDIISEGKVYSIETGSCYNHVFYSGHCFPCDKSWSIELNMKEICELKERVEKLENTVKQIIYLRGNSL